MFERKKKLDEYYIGRARCQAESATGAGFALSRCNILRTSPKKLYKTLNDRGTLYKARAFAKNARSAGRPLSCAWDMGQRSFLKIHRPHQFSMLDSVESLRHHGSRKF